MNKIIGVIIVLLLIAGGLYFFVFNPSSDNGENTTTETAGNEEESSTEEETTEEATEQQEEESSEESTEEASGEEEAADQESTTEENTDEASTEEPPEEENDESNNENTAEGNDNDYTAAEQCIMSELTECEGVSTDAQFQAYKDLVADGTLPQAPGSGCLPCAVKYSFEEKYGESRDIEAQPGGEQPEDQSYTGSPQSLISTYMFSLPEYYNGANERTLNYVLPDSNAYSQLTANKASGDFRDHMTYSTYIETVEQVSETQYTVYAYREYSHENSGGVYEAYVRYNVVQQNGRYYITDYTELRNVPVQ